MQKYQKEIWISGMAICLLVIYFLALEPTFAKIGQYSQTKAELAQIKQLKAQPNVSAELNHYLSKIDEVDKDIHESLHLFLSNYSHKHRITMVDFPVPSLQKEKGVQVQMHQVTVQGSYNELLKFIRHIESSKEFNKAFSFEFQTEKVPRQTGHKLYLKIYFKHVSLTQ